MQKRYSTINRLDQLRLPSPVQNVKEKDTMQKPNRQTNCDSIADKQYEIKKLKQLGEINYVKQKTILRTY